MSVPVTNGSICSFGMGVERRWRVALTRDEDIDAPLRQSLEDAGFIAVVCPVMVEGPAPDPDRLSAIAKSLEHYHWIICSSVRSVRAITAARGSIWPATVRGAAVGAVTAARMREAGVRDPIVGRTFNAAALWEALRPIDAWATRRVLVTTVAGGRRELIDGLRAEGGEVEELEAYSMRPRDPGELRLDWRAARPDAVLLASASQARHLIDSVGVQALRELSAIVAIGRTTTSVLTESGLSAHVPEEATLASGVEKLKSMLR